MDEVTLEKANKYHGEIKTAKVIYQLMLEDKYQTIDCRHIKKLVPNIDELVNDRILKMEDELKTIEQIKEQMK